MRYLSFPSGTPTPTRQTMELITNTKSFTSPLNGAVQTVSRKGSRWKSTLVWENLDGVERGIIQGVISGLNGQENRLFMRDYGAVKQGFAPTTDSPLIYDDRMGSYIVLKNVTPGITDYLKAGDYIKFNNELKIVTQDANSNVYGRVGVYFAPPARYQTAENQNAYVSGVMNVVWMMTNTPRWTTVAPNMSSITLEVMEDVLATPDTLP